MSIPFEGLARLDRMIHDPARLAITTALASCDGADFLFLQNLTGLTKGNLSSHLRRLEKAEIVLVQKGFDGKVPLYNVKRKGRPRCFRTAAQPASRSRSETGTRVRRVEGP